MDALPGHDVSQDTAHASECALERLDRAGVVMTLDLKRNGPAIAYIDDASMRARPSECIFAIFGQRLQPMEG